MHILFQGSLAFMIKASVSSRTGERSMFYKYLSLNILLLDEMFASLLLVLSGTFLMMFGGWLVLLCT